MDNNKDILENLRKTREYLLNYRKQTEISDDFAYTNGKISQIDEQIRSIDQQILKILQKQGDI